MQVLATLARWEGYVLLGGFLLIVLWKLATGEISLEELLEGDVRDPDGSDGWSTSASSARTQSLVFTLFVAGYYLLQVITNPKEFPKLPSGVVAGFGASQALYLGGKARAMLSERVRELFR